jgi:hypothetical protein
MISTANIGFFIQRFMLSVGEFNYGKRGILDLTHTRLFTFSSFHRAISQAGFDVLETIGIPGPYPLALGDHPFSRFLLRMNQLFIHLSRGLFSYQMFMRIKPQPSLEFLLQTAQQESQRRAALLEAAAGPSAGAPN